MKSIAVLLTCHNRKSKTLKCLNKLYRARLPKTVKIDTYLVDDGSSDGTDQAVSNNFPCVNIIKGSGSLFWNQGMRLAWNTATNNESYDFYLWLNDDTYIDEGAIIHLFNCFKKYTEINDLEPIVVGACRRKRGINEFSYGLRQGVIKLIPNGTIQEGNLLNGNLVLVSKSVFSALGGLSNNYTHAMGDHDYGMRAIEKGIKLITTKSYVATCALNKLIPKWCNPDVSLYIRWAALHSPLGLNIREYKAFRKRFWPKNYFVSILKIYFRCFFPSIYNKIKKNGR